MRYFHHKHIWIAVIGLALAAQVTAAFPGQATRTLLTVSGKIDASSVEGVALDLITLQRLPQKMITLKRKWEPSPTTFTGPLLRDVLAAFNARGTLVKARSLAGDQTQLSMEFASQVGVIVAFKGTDAVAWSQSNASLFLVYPPETSATTGARIPANNTFQLKSLAVE
jgi:hypothetical protein